MAIHELQDQQNQTLWIDLDHPTKEEMDQIAQKYDLHANAVQDCMDPEHLPKHESLPNFAFSIFRYIEHIEADGSDTLTEITRKISVFYSQKVLITVHRGEASFLDKIKIEMSRSKKTSTSLLFSKMIREVLFTYEKPMDRDLDQLEVFEIGVFLSKPHEKDLLEEGYYLKRRASVYKRILRVMHDLLPKIQTNTNFAQTTYQDLKDQLDSLQFYAEDLHEGISSLLNLHITLSSQKTNEASHKTNEVVRVLTLFSVFFLPLNFIAGVYGMNFEHMPELQSRHGYVAVLSLMALISIMIFVWFYKRGWLSDKED